MSAENFTESFATETRTHWVDPSAWISGLAFAAGVILSDPGHIVDQIFMRGPAMYLIPASYGAFLIAVLFIQRQMRKSLIASSFGSPQLLTTAGVFKFSRNPIYVAFLMPLASLATVSLAASMAAMGLYVLLMNVFVIAKEERELQAIFGKDYADYMSRSPRWLV